MQPTSKPSPRLVPGTKLGPYEIVAAAGAGGMGEVYRARDTRLGRNVAIKVLPAHLSSSADFKQRFEREARAVSSLSHPNICSLYDVGQQENIDYLVMEYLEGETLADRLERGALPLEQVLRIAIEITDALEKAHKQGVIHRDLKPGNIMLTKSGAKLMDFGLAKAAAPLPASPLEAATAAEKLTAMATQNKPLTAEGTLLGTFEYMSPEQLEGKEADVRSDIFALGAVLYEMITGKRAFRGKTPASVIAAVLASEPQPLTELQPLTPLPLDRLVRTSLAKDSDERWQSAHDVKLELKTISEASFQPEIPAVRTVMQRARWAWLLTLLLATLLLTVIAVVLGINYWRSERQSPQVVVSSIPPPSKSQFVFSGDAAGPVVISPDGRSLAFVATTEKGVPLLWARDLDDFHARSLPGTENAVFPFWSPDARWLGFFANGKLKKVALAGGSPLEVCDAPDARGGTWSSDGVIAFTPNIRAAIFRVPAAGGTPVQITKLNEPKHTTHRWPYFLPDGRHLLYLAANHGDPAGPDSALYWTSVDGGETRPVLQTAASAAYSAGHILFSRGGVLLAQAFDQKNGKLSGEPVQVANQVHVEEGTWRAVFDASQQEGILVYQTAPTFVGSQLVMFNRSGKRLETIGDPDRYFDIRLSPDGKKLAMTIGDPVGNIWVYDFARAVRTKLTFSSKTDARPFWSADGKQILFSRFFPFEVYRMAANGEGREELLYTDPRTAIQVGNGASHLSPDGRHLLLTVGPLGTTSIEVFDLVEKKSRPLLKHHVDEFDASFSPDGRWVAFTSSLSGRQEIYVVSFPETKGNWQISTNGGTSARWSRSGKEIFYVGLENTLMSAPVRASGRSLEVGTPRALFKMNPKSIVFPYDTADDRRFVVNTIGDEDAAPITLVTNWTAELKK